MGTEDKQKISRLGVWYLQTSCREHLALPAARLRLPGRVQSSSPGRAAGFVLQCKRRVPSSCQPCPASREAHSPPRSARSPCLPPVTPLLQFRNFPLTCCHSRTSTKTPLSLSLQAKESISQKSPWGPISPPLYHFCDSCLSSE